MSPQFTNFILEHFNERHPRTKSFFLGYVKYAPALAGAILFQALPAYAELFLRKTGELPEYEDTSAASRILQAFQDRFSEELSAITK